MTLANYFKALILMTMIALLYTHMQMRIYELAYKGKERENKIKELSDTKGRLSHDILALKSAQHLGYTLMDKEGAMKFMGQDNVMTYTMPQPVKPSPMTGAKMGQTFWQMVSTITTPEARAKE